jgi:5-methylcytosine-specific restriction endonuclease McrA
MDNPIIPLKLCKQCGKAKPKTIEFFESNGFTRAGTRTYKPACKSCLNKRPVLPLGHKACAACKAVYPATLDHFAANRSKGVDSYCKACKRLMTQKWLAVPGNKDRQLVAQKAFHLRNPHFARLKAHRRRAQVKTGVGVTSSDVDAKYQSQQGRCHWCGRDLQGKYEVDHVVPLSKGGAHAPSNICCSCKSCNSAKCAKTPWEFMGRLF